MFIRCLNCGQYFVMNEDTGSLFCSQKCKGKKKKKEKCHINLQDLYRKYKGICYLCGRKCNFEDCVQYENGIKIPGPTYPTIEHIIPVSKGGCGDKNNIALACYRCNNNKGSEYNEKTISKYNGFKSKKSLLYNFNKSKYMDDPKMNEAIMNSIMASND